MGNIVKYMKKSTVFLSIFFFIFGIYSLVKAYSATNPFFFIILFFSASFIILLSLAILVSSIIMARKKE